MAPRVPFLVETILRRFLEWAVGVTLAAIAAICFTEVVLRYGFGESFDWYDEFVGYLLVWLTFLGAVLARLHRRHIGIENLLDRLPKALGRGLAIVNHFLMVAIHVVLLVYGAQLVSRILSDRASTLPVPMGVVYLVLPLSAALMLIVESIHISRLWSGPLSSSESE